MKLSREQAKESLSRIFAGNPYFLASEENKARYSELEGVLDNPNVCDVEIDVDFSSDGAACSEYLTIRYNET